MAAEVRECLLEFFGVVILFIRTRGALGALGVQKERKKTDNQREGWEDGTPPPHRDFKEGTVHGASRHLPLGACLFLSLFAVCRRFSLQPSCHPAVFLLSSFSLPSLLPLSRRNHAGFSSRILLNARARRGRSEPAPSGPLRRARRGLPRNDDSRRHAAADDSTARDAASGARG